MHSLRSAIQQFYLLTAKLLMIDFTEPAGTSLSSA